MLLNVPLDGLQKPLWYRFPPGLIVLLAIGAIYITSKSLQAVRGKEVQVIASQSEGRQVAAES